jgi:hypothetical protein
VRPKLAIRTAYHLADPSSMALAVALLKADGYVCTLGSRGWMAVDHADADARAVQLVVAGLDPDAVMLRL